MRAYLIDPEARTVEAVDYDGDYRTIYKLIDAETFDVARVEANGDGLYVDDEGLYREERHWFIYKGYLQPLVGKALMLGVDGEGDSVPPKTAFEDVKRKVVFGDVILINGSAVFVQHELVD